MPIHLISDDEPAQPPLTERLRRFFRENPGEFLSREDAMLKFDADAKAISNAVNALKAEGRVGTGFFIYGKRPTRIVLPSR